MLSAALKDGGFSNRRHESTVRRFSPRRSAATFEAEVGERLSIQAFSSTAIPFLTVMLFIVVSKKRKRKNFLVFFTLWMYIL